MVEEVERKREHREEEADGSMTQLTNIYNTPGGENVSETKNQVIQTVK